MGGTSGGGGTGGDAGSSGAGGMAGSGGDGGQGGVGGVPEGQCDNPADNMLLTGLINAGANGRFIAHDCANLSCANELIETIFKQCVAECVEGEIIGLSSECAGCYGDLAWDSLPSCNIACGQSGAASCEPLCFTCPGYSTALTALDACAGRPSRDCPED